MSQVLVVSTVTNDCLNKDPRIAYKNLASTAASVTPSHDASNVDYVYDGMTTLKWRPVDLSPSIQFDGVFPDVDYIALAGVNWASAGCSLVVKDAGAATIASASGLGDNQPLLLIVDKSAQTTIKFEFTCTNTTLEVGEIYFGESMCLPGNVSTGYRPGRWSNNDLVVMSRTEQNQFGPSTVRKRGTTEQFAINLVPVEFMENEYRDFIADAQGLPIFFLWDKSKTDHAMYGMWEASNPTFTHSTLSSINMTIRGVV